MSLKLMNSARFYNFSIDRLRCVLQWREQPVPINRKTFDLLLYLIDHRDRLVTKDELLENLWPDQFVEERNLTQHVFLLRKALSAQGGDPKIIQTVARRGYRFTAPLDEDEVPAERMVLSATESITRVTVEEEEEEEMASVTSSPAVPASALGRGSRLGWVLTGSFAVLLLGLAGWFGWQRWLDKTGGACGCGSRSDDRRHRRPGSRSALVAALRMDLSQSPFVSLVSTARVRATLTEMKQNPDAPMSSAVARDVCERTNSQVILQGNVARAGQNFFLTEEATSCVNGAVLAEAKQEA